MGISKDGPNGHANGRVGNLVYYDLNGQIICRTIGKRKVDATLPQIISRAKTALSSKLLKRLKLFFNVGFSIEIKGTTVNAFNMAVSINSKKMIAVTYPDFQINFANLELSRGVLKKGDNIKALATRTSILFTWAAPKKMAWPESTDRVMMLAYFPEKERAVVIIGGKARNTGADLLLLPPSLRGLHAEVYIAFVAADSKQVSDSTYLGQIFTIAQ